jgi:hypothetical protein
LKLLIPLYFVFACGAALLAARHAATHATSDEQAEIAGVSPGPAAAAAGDPCADLRRDLEKSTARVRELEDAVERLRSELDLRAEARLEREREWLRYTQGFTALAQVSGANLPEFHPEVPPDPQAPPPEASPEPLIDVEKMAARSHAVFLALRSLFTIEQVVGFDLLESGNVHGGWTGPVVLRVLDDRGRPLGAISADRLRLEASRAARTVTIVLENGFERRAGVKSAFEGSPPDEDGRGGVRRVVLPDTDPKPWLDAVPELFRAEDRVEPIHDGSVDLVRLRSTLNQLLREDSPHGGYRVQGIGGVQVSVMRDVALDRIGSDGKIERRLFADRMAVLREEKGLMILLEGGSQVRGDRKTPFLDGRYRIFLPRASAEAWIEAGVPIPEPPRAPIVPEVSAAAADEKKP